MSLLGHTGRFGRRKGLSTRGLGSNTNRVTLARVLQISAPAKPWSLSSSTKPAAKQNWW